MEMDGYVNKTFDQPTKKYCQTLDLKENPELIAEYRRLHSREEHWKEIREGIRQVGILEMEIFIKQSRLFMIVETPLDFEWESAMIKLSTLPRQSEWEETVARFQKCAPDSTSAEKWQLMERMFHLYD